MIEPIDLRALAGDKFKTVLDESGADVPRPERAWHVRIPCRFGFIGVHGPGALLAHCHTARVIPRLLAIEGLAATQRGDGEVNATFPPGRLDAVAQALGARRQRRLSSEARERATSRLAVNRFHHTQGALLAPSCDSPGLAR